MDPKVFSSPYHHVLKIVYPAHISFSTFYDLSLSEKQG